MYSMMEDGSNTIRSKKFKKLTKAICGLVSKGLDFVLHHVYDQIDIFINIFACF